MAPGTDPTHVHHHVLADVMEVIGSDGTGLRGEHVIMDVESSGSHTIAAEWYGPTM
jgi:hypothetical protein